MMQQEFELDAESMCTPTEIKFTTTVDNRNIVFHGACNEEIGRLDWTGGKFKFEGDADEAAKVFIKSVGLWVNMVELNEIADQHYAWLKEMGWTKATPLESLALIASEVGEAVNECRKGEPTENFGVELADIILRTLGLARHHNIDIGKLLHKKMEANKKNGSRGRTI